MQCGDSLGPRLQEPDQGRGSSVPWRSGTVLISEL